MDALHKLDSKGGHRKALVMLGMLGVPVALGAPQPPSNNPQRLFEAGRYDETLGAIAAQGPQPSPASTYLAGQSRLRLNQNAEAGAEFAKLAAANNPWPLIGESATALAAGNHALAIERAMQATQIAPAEFHAHYQLGLAHSGVEQWEPAAAAFERAVAIDPNFAYSYYYAGLAYSRLKRVDQMASRLEYFLKLAPQAPERPAVTSLMRSVRGR
jgi:tetratricopeptide (TPR) repeat protein